MRALSAISISLLAYGTSWAAAAPCYLPVTDNCFYVVSGFEACVGDNDQPLARAYPPKGKDGQEASDLCGLAVRSTTIEIFNYLLKKKVKIKVVINQPCGELLVDGPACKEP